MWRRGGGGAGGTCVVIERGGVKQGGRTLIVHECALTSMTEDARPKNVQSNRIRRERETIETMIGIFCHGNHAEEAGKGTGVVLCRECADLDAYANRKLDLCPHGEGKPTCLKCPIHCYGNEERERVRAVMRYAGPRMLLRHPVIAVRHMLHGRRK